MFRRILIVLALLLPIAAQAQYGQGGYAPGSFNGNVGNSIQAPLPLPFLAFDGTTQAIIYPISNSSDSVMLEGGRSGIGPAIVCYSATDANVNCTMAALGTGGILLGNGSGGMLQLLDPGGVVQDYPSITPATVANTYTITYGYVAPQGHTPNITFTGNSFAAGGNGNIATGSGTVALGAGNQTYGVDCQVRGRFAYDHANCYGIDYWSSNDSSTIGDREHGLQNLNINTSSATPARLWADAVGTSAGKSVQLLPNSGTRFDIVAVARNQANSDMVSWHIIGTAKCGSTVSTCAITWQTGAAAVESGSVPASLTGIGIAVTADTSVGALNVTGTGVAATNISWLATVEWTEIVG